MAADSQTQTLPTRLRVLAWGVNRSTNGDITVDERTLAAFAATQRKYGREEVALDYEHNTVPGTPEYLRTQEPRTIAAVGKPVVIPGEGVFLDGLTWTSTGQTARENFPDLSAAPWLDKGGVVVGLHSAALTRTGAVYDLHQLAAEPPKDPDDYRLTFFSVPSIDNEITMAEPLTAEALASALQPILDRLTALEEAVKPKAMPELETLSARVNALEADKANAERNRILPLFASEGRCPKNPDTGQAYTPAELAALDLPTLRVLHANTPPTVPLSASPTAGEPAQPQLKGVARVAAAINAQIAGAK